MGTDFVVGTRPADGVCPDCGRVIRNGVWIRHREVAHGTVGSTTGADTGAVIRRPVDGVCPDCGRRIAPDLWANHRLHAHGTARVDATTRTTPAGPGAAAPRGSSSPRPAPSRATTPARGRETAPTDPGPTNPARARLRITVVAAVVALLCLVLYVGDLASWAENSEACQVVGHGRRAAAAVAALPRSCGFYTVVGPLQTPALIVGCAALLIALTAPLIPNSWFRSDRRA